MQMIFLLLVVATCHSTQQTDGADVGPELMKTMKISAYAVKDGDCDSGSTRRFKCDFWMRIEVGFQDILSRHSNWRCLMEEHDSANNQRRSRWLYTEITIPARHYPDDVDIRFTMKDEDNTAIVDGVEVEWSDSMDDPAVSNMFNVQTGLVYANETLGARIYEKGYGFHKKLNVGFKKIQKSGSPQFGYTSIHSVVLSDSAYARRDLDSTYVEFLFEMEDCEGDNCVNDLLKPCRGQCEKGPDNK